MQDRLECITLVGLRKEGKYNSGKFLAIVRFLILKYQDSKATYQNRL